MSVRFLYRCKNCGEILENFIKAKTHCLPQPEELFQCIQCGIVYGDLAPARDCQCPEKRGEPYTCAMCEKYTVPAEGDLCYRCL